MKVADLDMTDNTTQCPDSLELRTTPLRTCTAVNSDTATCSSNKFSVDGVKYSKVCGRIRAYQVGIPDAFSLSGNVNGRESNIDTYYVDGISLNRGYPPRQHIWTFACIFLTIYQISSNICPCTTTVQSPPTFVGNDYFCDAPVPTTAEEYYTFYDDYPLWIGAGYHPQNACCCFNNPPWFYNQLPQVTTDDIEMRACHDQGRDNEDIAIEIVEIYVH